MRGWISFKFDGSSYNDYVTLKACSHCDGNGNWNSMGFFLSWMGCVESNETSHGDWRRRQRHHCWMDCGPILWRQWQWNSAKYTYMQLFHCRFNCRQLPCEQSLRTHFGDIDYYINTEYEMQLQIRLCWSTYPILHESDHIPFASKQTSQVTFVELLCCRSVTRDWFRNIKPAKSWSRKMNNGSEVNPENSVIDSLGEIISVCHLRVGLESYKPLRGTDLKIINWSSNKQSWIPHDVMYWLLSTSNTTFL